MKTCTFTLLHTSGSMQLGSSILRPLGLLLQALFGDFAFDLGGFCQIQGVKKLIHDFGVSTVLLGSAYKWWGVGRDVCGETIRGILVAIFVMLIFQLHHFFWTCDLCWPKNTKNISYRIIFGVANVLKTIQHINGGEHEVMSAQNSG